MEEAELHAAAAATLLLWNGGLDPFPLDPGEQPQLIHPLQSATKRYGFYVKYNLMKEHKCFYVESNYLAQQKTERIFTSLQSSFSFCSNRPVFNIRRMVHRT